MGGITSGPMFLIFLIDLAERCWIFLILRGGPGHGLTELEGAAGHVPGEWPGLAVGHPLRIKKIQHLSAKSIKKILKKMSSGRDPSRAIVFFMFFFS